MLAIHNIKSMRVHRRPSAMPTGVWSAVVMIETESGAQTLTLYAESPKAFGYLDLRPEDEVSGIDTLDPNDDVPI